MWMILYGRHGLKASVQALVKSRGNVITNHNFRQQLVHLECLPHAARDYLRRQRTVSDPNEQETPEEWRKKVNSGEH